MSKKVIIAALSTVVAMGIASQASAAEASDAAKIAKPTKMMKGMEKCYGIAKSGKNDCGSATESCSGQVKADGAKNAWIAVPKGTCDKIVGGSTTEGSST